MLHNLSPFEAFFHKKPDVSHLRIFGCICYVHLSASGKLDHHARKCIFVGYSPTQKGYKCFDHVHGKLYVSRDVQFSESLPFLSLVPRGSNWVKVYLVRSHKQIQMFLTQLYLVLPLPWKTANPLLILIPINLSIHHLAFLNMKNNQMLNPFFDGQQGFLNLIADLMIFIVTWQLILLKITSAIILFRHPCSVFYLLLTESISLLLFLRH